MGTEELAKRCAFLSISGGVPTLKIGGDSHRQSTKEVSHCLVGKVLSRKRVNREAFISVISKIWNTKGELEIEVIGDNVFLFRFGRLDDKLMVWSRGPWHFNNCLIILEKKSGPGEILKMQFRRAEFWVQIFNIPLVCMNMKIARMIAEMIGEVVEIPLEDRECWGKFLRVKVAIDVSQPLMRGLMLNLEEFDTVIAAPIKYERLPKLCYGCEFGSWLRVVPPVRVRDSKQKEYGETKVPDFDSFEEDMEDEGNKDSSGKGPTDINSRQLEEADNSASVTEAKNVSGEGNGEHMRKVAQESLASGAVLGDEMEGMETDLGNVIKNDNTRRLRDEVMELIPTVDKGKELGSSPKKPSSRKWKRLAREVTNPKSLVGLSSSIRKILLAKQITKKGGRSRENSPAGKSPASKDRSQFARQNLEELELIAMLTWGLWFNRNLLWHNKQGKNSDELYCWAMEVLAEFQEPPHHIKGEALTFTATKTGRPELPRHDKGEATASPATEMERVFKPRRA
ncbi:hypothetical protein EZV62_025345 [Acer yangbiense]|uniref:DUF4283 domain-containing protein n=1 Tax=Acer yangbiense TaxID=1000413 RepID=A0A5C7GXL5_9ROSI|nr:hypothetical protein EZV62_025345 [Acer yangbiense]